MDVFQSDKFPWPHSDDNLQCPLALWARGLTLALYGGREEYDTVIITFHLCRRRGRFWSEGICSIAAVGKFRTFRFAPHNLHAFFKFVAGDLGLGSVGRASWMLTGGQISRLSPKAGRDPQVFNGLLDWPCAARGCGSVLGIGGPAGKCSGHLFAQFRKNFFGPGLPSHCRVGHQHDVFALVNLELQICRQIWY